MNDDLDDLAGIDERLRSDLPKLVALLDRTTASEAAPTTASTRRAGPPRWPGVGALAAAVVVIALVGGVIVALRSGPDLIDVTSGPDASAQGAPATLTMNVFSGRPNPEWALEPGELDEVSEAISLLEPASMPTPDPGLGFTGFQILYTADEPNQRSVEVRPTNVVLRTDNQPDTALEDPGGSVMRLLSRAAAPRINDDGLRDLLDPWLQ